MLYPLSYGGKCFVKFVLSTARGLNSSLMIGALGWFP